MVSLLYGNFCAICCGPVFSYFGGWVKNEEFNKKKMDNNYNAGILEAKPAAVVKKKKSTVKQKILEKEEKRREELLRKAEMKEQEGNEEDDDDDDEVFR